MLGARGSPDRRRPSGFRGIAPAVTVVDTVDMDRRSRENLPTPGQLIGERYRVEQLLGTGGMGSVYLATHVDIRKKVAIKVLRPELVDTADIFKRFRQEAKAASKIGHANIVNVSDFGQLPGGAPYFVMEYLQGSDLGSMLRREGAMQWQRAFMVANQICSALHAAHEAGIIHRDVKPENFFIVSGEQVESIVGSGGKAPADMVKVLDFGIAKLTGNDQSFVTRTGVFIGTPEYMSPEQAEGLDLDGRVDIYGVGVMLYQLVTGRVPFKGVDEFDILNKHCTVPAEPPSKARPEGQIPPRADAVILRALAKKRDERFQTMEAFGAALVAAVEAKDEPLAATPTATTDDDVAVPGSLGKSVAIGVIVAALAVIVVVLVLVLT